MSSGRIARNDCPKIVEINRSNFLAGLVGRTHQLRCPPGLEEQNLRSENHFIPVNYIRKRDYRSLACFGRYEEYNHVTSLNSLVLSWVNGTLQRAM